MGRSIAAIAGPPAPCRTALDRLVDAADARLTIGADAAVAVEVGIRIARRRRAVDDLAIEQRTLQIRGREVPAPHP
eukprot:3899121-Prymnesium_polylepis.1